MPDALDPSVIVDLLLALGLGLLVGFQRQAVHEPVAGIRTFALLTMLGCLCGMMVPALGVWIVPAGLLALAALLITANVLQLGASEGRDRPEPGGLTTEVAALILFLAGAWLPLGSHAVSLVVAGAVAVLLWAKERLHNLVARTTAEDLHALMQFVLLALVILPVLPDRAFGPFAVLNPREIWLIVVLVVGVSLAGYLTRRAFGERAGTVVTGILGGVISSTATTVGMARQATELAAHDDSPDSSLAPAVVTVIASTVSFVRVSGLALGLAGAHAPALAGPFIVMTLAMGAISVVQTLRARASRAAPAKPERPRELSTAIVFGALYALVILAVAFARDRLGQSGLYGISVLAGLTDVDAITLSAGELVRGGMDIAGAARAVLLAAAVNTIVKAGIAVAVAGGALARIVSVALAAMLVACGLAYAAAT